MNKLQRKLLFLAVICTVVVVLQVKQSTGGHLQFLVSKGQASTDNVTVPLPDSIRMGAASIPGLPPYTYFILLVIQAGCQPLLVKSFMPTTIVRSTAVLGQEFAKLFFSIMFLAASGDFLESMGGWTISDAVVAAGVPAALYVVQNYCNLMANQVLPPVTFVVLNQMKTLSTAWCCFLLMGQQQSQVQVMALIMLVFSTLVVQKIVPLGSSGESTKRISSPAKDAQHTESISQKNEATKTEEAEALLGDVESTLQASKENVLDTEGSKTKTDAPDEHEEAGRQLTMGAMPALFASFLSGMAGTLSQRTLQTFHRSPHVFNMELAVFSSMFLIMSLMAGSPDGQKIREGGASQGWTWKTWVPIVSNSLGGILVGMVTKYQGAVVKSFCMIFGMVLSGILQELILGGKGGGLTTEQLAGGSLGALSLYLHASHPAS